ncbi:carboxyl-terminal processing protease [Anaerosporobacter mobilis DSM 15930]|uniref:Carboxyl-terminal processing protease n=1 Tax=Anaerosporobacter mobilis DSM 15930 TaxID=1120996 RepID=A0A1M7HSF0_9FIRM|nr:S41 family peptidase [Anaerosporobacter mobilis]SHM31370.1 carboxyl-terminal processing protease [Anaerosporobacter mobilis DSM 15930]
MKNRYFQGMLVGLLVSALFFSVLFAGYVRSNSIQSAEGNNGSTNLTTEADSDNSLMSKAVKSKLNRIKSIIDTYYLDEINEDKMVEGMYKGLVSSLEDPYSVYYTKDEFAALMESSSGSYCGIGAYVSQDVKTGVITIVKPFEGGPAYKAGMLPGDIIYKVSGEEATGKDLSEIVSKMKGEEGTTVDLEIIRAGESDPIKLTIERRTVEVPTISYEMLDNKVGYIQIAEFDEVTGPQFRSAITDLDNQGMKGLVIDLRNNPGGLLDTVCDMLDRMLPEGLIVYTEDKNGTRTEEVKSTAEESFDKPLVVMINGNSASASEVFAGAIQDYGIGTILGTTSFGKGIVQSVIPLSDGSGVKVTVSKYYTPKGRNIHEIGIEPDVVVELKDKLKTKVVIDKSEDNQLQEAIKIINEKSSK